MSLQKMLFEACEEMGGDVTFHNTYSGRGMYGHKCVGVSGSHANCMAVIRSVITDAGDAYANAALDIKQEDGDDKYDVAGEFFRNAVETLLIHDRDNMGRDMIIYWPDLETIEDFNDEDDY